MIVHTVVQNCAKYLISRLKIGGVMAISLVAMTAATLILFLDVVFVMFSTWLRIKRKQTQTDLV